MCSTAVTTIETQGVCAFTKVVRAEVSLKGITSRRPFRTGGRAPREITAIYRRWAGITRVSFRPASSQTVSCPRAVRIYGRGGFLARAALLFLKEEGAITPTQEGRRHVGRPFRPLRFGVDLGRHAGTRTCATGVCGPSKARSFTQGPMAATRRATTRVAKGPFGGS